MKREIIRVEPLSTYLEKYKAPASTVTKHGDTISMFRLGRAGLISKWIALPPLNKTVLFGCVPVSDRWRASTRSHRTTYQFG